jgi:hypothetical protein
MNLCGLMSGPVAESEHDQYSVSIKSGEYSWLTEKLLASEDELYYTELLRILSCSEISYKR